MGNKINFYRVKGETITEEPEGFHIDEDIVNGVDCNGFVFAAFKDGGITSWIEHVNTAELIEWIACDKVLMKAARMAILYDALREKDTAMKSIEQLFGLAE